MRILLIASFLAACGGDDGFGVGEAPDSGVISIAPEPFCGRALPTTAPPSIEISGDIVPDAGETIGSQGIKLELWARNGTKPIATEGTFQHFELDAATDGTPIDGYIHATDTASVYYFVGQPFAANYQFDRTLTLTDKFDFAGLAPEQEDTGTIFIAMHDCSTMDSSLAGESVKITPAGTSTIRYIKVAGTTQTDAGTQTQYAFSASPNSQTFAAVIVNAPLGDVTITTSGSRLMRTGHVRVFPYDLTKVDLYPQ